MIDGETISCVAADCPDPPGASVFTVTDAFVYPGFIDAHNHVAYNVFPKWTPPRLYQNRSQWQAATPYQLFKAPYNTLKAQLFCEMVRWGEIAALMSGITTVQGTARIRRASRGWCGTSRTRVILGSPSITSVLTSSTWDPSGGASTRRRPRRSSSTSRRGSTSDPERSSTRSKARPAARADGDHSRNGVWGDGVRGDGEDGLQVDLVPQSNLALYGTTTNIPLAMKHGIDVSLGIDWNVSGSDTVFDELRVAAAVNREQWNGAIPASAWVDMVTRNPARALAVDHLLGHLQPGRKADIAIIRARTADASGGLLLNAAGDVEAVWISGELLYGKAPVVDAVRPGACELTIVQGATKRICAPMLALAAKLGKQFPYLGSAGEDAQSAPGTVIRHKVLVDGCSRRPVAKEFGISRVTVGK